MTALAARIARLIWSAAFLVGAFNHGWQIVEGGWLPYTFAPMALNWFWTLLLPIDLAVVALLWTRVRAGVGLGAAVMIADVAVNSWFMATQGIEGLPMAVQLQTLFLGFVLGSAPLLWRRGRT